MIRPISIEAVLGGFIVRVGCQTVVFRTRAELLNHLDSYLQYPEQVEAKFVASAENARHFPQAGPMEVAGREMGRMTLDDLARQQVNQCDSPAASPTPIGGVGGGPLYR